MVSSDLRPKFCYEAVLFPNDIPGYDAFAHAPQVCIDKVVAVRTQALTFLGPGTLAVSDCVSILSSPAKKEKFAQAPPVLGVTFEFVGAPGPPLDRGEGS